MSLLSTGCNGGAVFIGLHTQLSIEKPMIWFKVDRGNELDAALLEARLDTLLFERMQEIRREAYLQGWKDKAAKKAKQTYFSSELP